MTFLCDETVKINDPPSPAALIKLAMAAGTMWHHGLMFSLPTRGDKGGLKMQVTIGVDY